MAASLSKEDGQGLAEYFSIQKQAGNMTGVSKNLSDEDITNLANCIGSLY